MKHTPEMEILLSAPFDKAKFVAPTNAEATSEQQAQSARCALATGSGHALKRNYAGHGIESSITPTCSCGWIGRTEHAWNDWQCTNVSEQEQEHLRGANIPR